LGLASSTLGFIFISKIFFLSAAWIAIAVPVLAFAADPAPPQAAPKSDRTLQPEEEDFTTTPFTRYGEFNQDNEEDEDLKFFQNGRFAGISAGIGFQTVTGNRGLLWQGGVPLLDFKVHYWFDFNFAIALGISFVNAYYEDPSRGHVDLSMNRIGLDIKYYFDTKNVGAAISFANPYLLGGIGAFAKNETVQKTQVQDQDSNVGFDVGGGLEFALVPKKTYFEIEGKLNIVNFKDTFTTRYQTTTPKIDDLTGQFFTLTANVLFTW